MSFQINKHGNQLITIGPMDVEVKTKNRKTKAIAEEHFTADPNVLRDRLFNAIKVKSADKISNCVRNILLTQGKIEASAYFNTLLCSLVEQKRLSAEQIS